MHIYLLVLWAWQRRPACRPISVRHSATRSVRWGRRRLRMKKIAPSEFHHCRCQQTIFLDASVSSMNWHIQSEVVTHRNGFCTAVVKKECLYYIYRMQRHVFASSSHTFALVSSPWWPAMTFSHAALCMLLSPLKELHAPPALPKESLLFWLRCATTKSVLRRTVQTWMIRCSSASVSCSFRTALK